MTQAVPRAPPGLAEIVADRWLLGLGAAGLLLRVGCGLWLDPILIPSGDETTYLNQAAVLAETGRFETGNFVRPPLYFLVVAGLRLLAQLTGAPWPLMLRLLQCLVSVATAVPVYRTARRLAGLRAARLAVAFLLFDPTLVAFSHLLWPETLYLFAMAVVWDGIAGLDSRGRGFVAGLGLVFGLAMLLKPVAGLFALLLAGSWLVRHGPPRALRLCLVFGGTAALVVAPWAIRNQLHYGPAIVLENQVPYNLWIGNDPGPPKAIVWRWASLPDPVTRSRVGWERGLASIEADPRGFVARSAGRALNLWGLEFFVVRHAVIGGYGSVERGTLLGMFWVLQLCWAVALLAAAAGLRAAARDPTLRLVLLYAAVFTVLVAAMVGTTRFRIPFAFPLAIAGGIGVDRALARRLSWRDLVAVVIALAVLGLSAARPVFRMIGGGHVERVPESVRDDWRFFRY